MGDERVLSAGVHSYARGIFRREAGGNVGEGYRTKTEEARRSVGLYVPEV